MSQIKLLKISTDGIPVEMDTTNDDITLKSYTVSGGGPVLSASGLNLTTQPITNSGNVTFTDPTINTINQTTGTLVINNIMAKERSNSMTTSGEILFPTVSNTASQVDNLQLPTIAGAPTATPTNTGAGFIVYDSTNLDPYIWDGTKWENLNLTKEAQSVGTIYTAGATITARDLVYVSAADTITSAIATAETTSRIIGFAESSAVVSGSLQIRSDGVLNGFTGLTAGSRYYLSTTVAGGIQTAVPSGTGQVVVQCGLAKSTTSMQILIQQMGRRA